MSSSRGACDVAGSGVWRVRLEIPRAHAKLMRPLARPHAIPVTHPQRLRGIRGGLGLDEITLDLERLAEGAELIAIAGANGSGKTTVMDSLHPLC